MSWWQSLLGAKVWVSGVVAVLGVGTFAIVHSSDQAQPPPVMSLRQWHFSLVVRMAEERARAGNPVTLISARRERDRQLCRLLPHHHVVGWLGHLEDISTTLAQDGTVRVQLDDDVALDTAPKAHLQPDTQIFESVADLHDGEQVRFSGYFVGDPCFTSSNLFHHPAVLSPDFAFRFTSIRAAARSQ